MEHPPPHRRIAALLLVGAACFSCFAWIDEPGDIHPSVAVADGEFHVLFQCNDPRRKMGKRGRFRNTYSAEGKILRHRIKSSATDLPMVPPLPRIWPVLMTTDTGKSVLSNLRQKHGAETYFLQFHRASADWMRGNHAEPDFTPGPLPYCWIVGRGGERKVEYDFPDLCKLVPRARRYPTVIEGTGMGGMGGAGGMQVRGSLEERHGVGVCFLIHDAAMSDEYVCFLASVHFDLFLVTFDLKAGGKGKVVRLGEAWRSVFPAASRLIVRRGQFLVSFVRLPSQLERGVALILASYSPVTTELTRITVTALEGPTTTVSMNFIGKRMLVASGAAMADRTSPPPYVGPKTAGPRWTSWSWIHTKVIDLPDGADEKE